MNDVSNSVAGLGRRYDILGVQMRNMQALATAQQQMLTGLSMLTKKQAEIMDAFMRRVINNTRVAPSPVDMRGFIGSRIDELKRSIVEIQASSNMLGEIMARSAGDVASTLQARMMEALDELKTFAAEAIPAAAGTH